MDISFLTMLPQFQQLSEEKKQFLIKNGAAVPNDAADEETLTEKELKK